MTAHISCISLTHIGLQIPKCWTKWHRGNGTIQNSLEFKALTYVLHDICQVAALIDLSRNKTRIPRQEILDIRRVAALNFAIFFMVGCIRAYVVVRVWLMSMHMCVKRSCLRCMVVKVKV